MSHYFFSFFRMLFSTIFSKIMGLCRMGMNSFQFFWFFVRTLAALGQKPFQYALFFQQWRMMAFESIPLIALTALFTGMVLALQSASAFGQFSTEATLPHIVTFSVVRELAPVLGGLMMAGRWGASMTAELSTMRVTDQIDALVTLSTHPFSYLVVPRVLSAMLALPVLILTADVIGIFGGGIIAVQKCSMLSGQYISKTLEILSTYDVFSGLLKACVFGLTIGLIGCYQGYYATGGTQGVGIATTRSVVQSSIFILLLNYLLTLILFQ